MPFAPGNDSKTLPKKGEKLQEPKDYRVVLLNDDFTTMDFVVQVLRSVFHLSMEDASYIMLCVHKKGRGIVGVYTFDIAHTKADQVHKMADESQFPLRCIVEEV